MASVIFFSAQFNNNSNKKIIQPMGSTRPNPTHMSWVGLMWWVGLGWIFFNLSWRIGSKNPLNSTQPDPCTPLVTKMGRRFKLKWFNKHRALIDKIKNLLCNVKYSINFATFHLFPPPKLKLNSPIKFDNAINGLIWFTNNCKMEQG